MLAAPADGESEVQRDQERRHPSAAVRRNLTCGAISRAAESLDNPPHETTAVYTMLKGCCWVHVTCTVYVVLIDRDRHLSICTAVVPLAAGWRQVREPRSPYVHDLHRSTV